MRHFCRQTVRLQGYKVTIVTLFVCLLIVSWPFFHEKTQTVQEAAEEAAEETAEEESLLQVQAKTDTQDLVCAYALKVGSYHIYLASLEDVTAVLQAAVDKYDTDGAFLVEIVTDESRKIQTLTAQIVQNEEASETVSLSALQGGIFALLFEDEESYQDEASMSFSDYDLGILSMYFAQHIEIARTYVSWAQISEATVAIADLVEEQEVATEYEVVSGDTLSAISMALSIPMETIVEMNDALDDVNSTLQIGQTLIVTVPEPALSVVWTAQSYIEEVYDADIVYVDNDSWYTTKSVTLQQPSAGFRKIIADITYENDSVISRTILKEEVVMEAVEKIVERGTIVPPTYIKPISGGTLSSGFGSRTAPTAGASSYHKGVDWATPIGTPVYASSGGTVVKAGWASGYGYVIYIDHPDGRQTRYAHLSKIQVSVGDTVKQGQQIALSGNSGVSTGPHVHFEILINGTQVNPLSYLN